MVLYLAKDSLVSLFLCTQEQSGYNSLFLFKEELFSFFLHDVSGGSWFRAMSWSEREVSDEHVDLRSLTLLSGSLVLLGCGRGAWCHCCW